MIESQSDKDFCRASILLVLPSRLKEGQGSHSETFTKEKFTE